MSKAEAYCAAMLEGATTVAAARAAGYKSRPPKVARDLWKLTRRLMLIGTMSPDYLQSQVAMCEERAAKLNSRALELRRMMQAARLVEAHEARP